MKTPQTILVLSDEESALTGMVQLLGEAGHDVNGAVTFTAAKRLLKDRPYDLLVTDVYLRPFDGLQLILESRIVRPEIAAIVVSAYPEPGVEVAARQCRAAYRVKPVNRNEFLGLVARKLAEVQRQRRSPRKRMTGLTASLAKLSATVVDVSYEGFGFELTQPAGDLPSWFEIDMPGLGRTTQAELIWADRGGRTGVLRGGAAILEADSHSVAAWRRLVDGLPDAAVGAADPRRI